MILYAGKQRFKRIEDFACVHAVQQRARARARGSSLLSVSGLHLRFQPAPLYLQVLLPGNEHTLLKQSAGLPLQPDEMCSDGHDVGNVICGLMTLLEASLAFARQ
jgi:hypothetical protein